MMLPVLLPGMSLPAPPPNIFLWLPETNSLIRLLAALPMVCLVPIMVPFTVLPPVPERDGDLPLEGRLVLHPATFSGSLGEELGLFEVLADNVRSFSPPEAAPLDPLPLWTCHSLLVAAKTPAGTWDGKADVEVDAGSLSLGTDLLDLPFPPDVAPLFSLNSSGLDPAKVGLSHLSKDIRLPKYLEESLAPCVFRLEDVLAKLCSVLKLDVLWLNEPALSLTCTSSSEDFPVLLLVFKALGDSTILNFCS